MCARACSAERSARAPSATNTSVAPERTSRRTAFRRPLAELAMKRRRVKKTNLEEARARTRRGPVPHRRTPGCTRYLDTTAAHATRAKPALPAAEEAPQPARQRRRRRLGLLEWLRK